jgi:hypothetical protein
MRQVNILQILFMILVSFNFSYSQVNSLVKNQTSEIVFLKDSNFKEIIKKIIKKDKLCQIDNVSWTIEFLKDNMIQITKYSLENLIFLKGSDNIYTTIIDDNFFFLYGNVDLKNILNKSGYSVDLQKFLDKVNYSTIDYSFWVIQKKDGKKYEILKEKIYKCN